MIVEYEFAHLLPDIIHSHRLSIEVTFLRLGQYHQPMEARTSHSKIACYLQYVLF